MTTQESVRWSVFTKPWPDTSPVELAALVQRMGFNGIELPLRPGYQVEPANAMDGLRKLTTILSDHGLQIYSVASSADEPMLAACAEFRIPVIRIMVPIYPNGFLATGDIIRRQLDDLIPLCERYGVRVGVQPHYDYYIADSMDLANLLAGYDSRYILGIWDAAHDGLARKAPEHGLEVLWDRLAMINLKNAHYRRTNEGASAPAVWEPYFTHGRDGMSRWDRALQYATSRGYDGVICLPAEYDDESDLESFVTADLDYARQLVEESTQS